jgi:hypothetical protein
MNSIRLLAIPEYILLIAGRPSGVCRLFGKASHSLPVVWQASAVLAGGFGQPSALSEQPTFEARVRESRTEDTIVAPAEGSEQATAAASGAPPKDEEDEEIEAFDAHLMDNYDGMDWSRLKKYQLPL